MQKIAELLAKREGRTVALDQRTALLVQALIGSGDRNLGSAQRARQIGALLAR